MSFPKILFLSLLIGFSLKGFSQTVDTLIDVGTHKLHFNIIKGEGIPIVFESGAGNDGTVWNDLLNPLSQQIGAPLITYDRAGFGQSGIDTANISIASEVENLELALSKLQIEKNSPHLAQEQGISIIYQEFSLVPDLSVSENLFLGHFSQTSWINWRNMHEEARESAFKT